MSTLKMVLHREKTLRTTIQKNLPKSQKVATKNICGRVSSYSNHFFAAHSNFTYDSEAYDLMKLYFETFFEILASSQFKLYTLYSN